MADKHSSQHSKKSKIIQQSPDVQTEGMSAEHKHESTAALLPLMINRNSAQCLNVSQFNNMLPLVGTDKQRVYLDQSGQQ